MLSKEISGFKGSEVKEYCDLCGNHLKGREYARVKGYQILYCQKCRLLWTNPLEYYSSEKTEKSTYFAEEIYIKNADIQKVRFRKQLKIFHKKANISDLRSLKILEVGSGLGFFLDICEEVGILAEGCDISVKAVSYANRERERESQVWNS